MVSDSLVRIQAAALVEAIQGLRRAARSRQYPAPPVVRLGQFRIDSKRLIVAGQRLLRFAQSAQHCP